MARPPARMDEGFGIVARVRREERRRRVMRVVTRVVAGVAIAGLVAATGWGSRWWRQRRGAPAASGRPAISTEIDFLKVHRELLPAWIASEFSAGRNDERRGERQLWAVHHLRALRSAVAGDPELVAIVDELHAASKDVASHTDAVLALGERWNRRLQALGAGFLVEAQVWTVARQGFVYMNVYRVLAGLTVPRPDGKQSYRVRFLERVDSLAGREHYLGRASKARDGALVIVDRVREFAADDLWPLLDESGDADRPEEQRPLARAARAEIRAGLPHATGRPRPADVLTRAAPLRRRLDAILDHANQRAANCFSQQRLALSWDQLDEASIAALRSQAVPDAVGLCVPLVTSDVEALAGLSRAFAGEPALAESVRALEAWATRPTVAHELRHVTDDERGGGSPDAIACTGCPTTMNGQQRGELAAFLASLQAPGVSAVELLRLQELADHLGDGAKDPAGRPLPHVAALRFLLPKLDAHDDGAIARLRDQAAALDRQLFGEAAMVLPLPAHFPAVLPAPLPPKRDDPRDGVPPDDGE